MYRITGRDDLWGQTCAAQAGPLNQWAHWARARGPGFFFEGAPTGCGEIIFFTNYLFLMLLHDRTNTSSAYLVNLLAAVRVTVAYWECLT